jgi:hypothetical protein
MTEFRDFLIELLSFVNQVRHQEKLKVKEILGNGVDQGLRLVDFLPDILCFVGEFLLNIICVVFLCTKVAQDEENFFSGLLAE